MEYISSVFLISVITILCFIYIKRKQSYWLRHGIPFIEPNMFSDLKSTSEKERLSDKLTSIYRKHKGKGPMIGLYFFLKPVLLITDLDLVRDILITNFQHFQDRGFFYNEKHDPLSANLFRIEYEMWKPMRSKLTPTFTSGKMKFMFSTIVSVGNELVDTLSNAIRIDDEVEVHDWMARYTTDVIGTCAYGIECNSLKDPLCEFRTMSKNVFTQPKLSYFQQLLMKSFVNIAKLAGARVYSKEVTDFFFRVVEDTIEHREKNNVQRNDFMSLLIDMKNSKNTTDNLTNAEIAAQAFAFFAAGFETSSTALNFCLYELAMEDNKHVQDRARREIHSVLEKYNGNLTYEALNEMTYIAQVINGMSVCDNFKVINI